MSDTPRTDAEAWMELVGMMSDELHVVEADFARKLERELAAVAKERDELRKDKARLDWLPKQIYFGKMTAREAIDAEMAKENRI